MLKTKLKIFREHLKKTQAEFADSIGVSKRGWQTYEEGKSVPGGNVFKSLSRLGCNLNWLFDDNTPMLFPNKETGDIDRQQSNLLEQGKETVAAPNISSLKMPSAELGLGESVELLAKIYASKNHVITRAITANLQAYNEAIRNTILVREMKERIKEMDKK